MKKVLALVLAVVLSFGALSVFAAPTTAEATAIKAFDLDASAQVANVAAGGDRTLFIPFNTATLADLAGTGTTDLSGITAADKVGIAVSGAKKVVFADAAVNTLTGDDLKYLNAAATGVIVTWAANATTSEKEQTLKATVTISGKDASNKSYKTAGLRVEVKYDPSTTLVDHEEYVATTSGIIYKASEKATVEFNVAGDADLELRLLKDRKVVVNASTTVPAAIDEAYPWQSLTALAITGDVAGASAWKLNFTNVAEGEGFLYAVVDGKLVNLDKAALAYNKTDEILTLTGTGAIPALVLSATDLKVTATAGDKAPTEVPNPGTGTSDMIGVAVVMAVVSLGAAGAVAFKKASK